jgi:hypothetical protein
MPDEGNKPRSAGAWQGKRRPNAPSDFTINWPQNPVLKFQGVLLEGGVVVEDLRDEQPGLFVGRNAVA